MGDNNGTMAVTADDTLPTVDADKLISNDTEVTSDKEEGDDGEYNDHEPRQFSSEYFKLCVENLPKYFGVGQAKKLFNKRLKLQAHKIKPGGFKATYMYVCFKNEEDKEKALAVLNGFNLKGKNLKAHSAVAVQDLDKKKPRDDVVDERPVEVRLQEVICPYGTMGYEDQLEKKQSDVTTIVKRMASEIKRNNPDLAQYVDTDLLVGDPEQAILQKIVPSPIINGYRNKCEFTIGFKNVPGESSPEESTKGQSPAVQDLVSKIAVGFRLASYKKGSVEVVSLTSLESPTTLLPHISPRMIEVGILFEKLVKASGLLPYSPVTSTGNWRTLMLRSAGEGSEEQLLLMAVIDPMNLSQEQIERVRQDITLFFTEGGGKSHCPTSIYLHLAPVLKAQGGKERIPELLHGSVGIEEKLFQLSFSISPQAFFQVNTKAAEILYRTAGKLADLGKSSTLVDVCCGTGTIGLCLADRVRKVIGVELIAEAVRDARKNAELNGVDNCQFFAGKAEEILAEILRDIDSKEIVAIVDPPRAGLHARALNAIRNTLAIRRLVYISCDASNAMKNFVDLCKPASKTAHGDPFRPVKIIPVDLFPHGKQFELVLLFERTPTKPSSQPDASK